ncbi:unnamed protein product [Closterium sp. NIES-65]|nr:unnamed protein product [Closterium sp. NIES-65]
MPLISLLPSLFSFLFFLSSSCSPTSPPNFSHPSFPSSSRAFPATPILLLPISLTHSPPVHSSRSPRHTCGSGRHSTTLNHTNSSTMPTSEVAGIWVVGGSFFASGDVNAAAEESVFADPEAADQVLTSGTNIHVLGLNVTTQVTLTGTNLASLCTRDTAAPPAAGESEHGTASSAAVASVEADKSGSQHAASPSPAASLVARLVQAYRAHHQQSNHINGIFLHDACAVAAITAPSLFSFKRGSVRVESTGVGRGCTLMDYSLKK